MAQNKQLLEIQQTIYQSSNPTRNWLHNRRRRWIESNLQGLREKQIAVAMEIGPGSGIYLPKLAEIAEQIIATDIETAFLDNAESMKQSIDNLHCVADDITCSELEANSCDLILCTEVVEHIADSQAALSGIQRLLRPGGVLILTTPQRYSPLEMCAKIAFLPGVIELVRFIYGEAIEETGHINLMTATQLQAQLSTSNFEVLSYSRFGMYLPLIAEFGGKPGLKLLQKLELLVSDSFLSFLLWTQCYVLQPRQTAEVNDG